MRVLGTSISSLPLMHHCLLNYIYFYTKSPIVPSFQDPILSIRRSCVLPVSITVLFFESYTLKILQVCLFPSSPLPGVREMLSLAYILSSLALTHTGYPDRSFPSKHYSLLNVQRNRHQTYFCSEGIFINTPECYFKWKTFLPFY